MKPKAYLVDCSCDNEFTDCPAAARFEIDEATAKEIRRLSRYVKKNRLHTVEKFNYRAEWLRTRPDELVGDETEPNEMRTECDILCISDDSFWFRCYLKHCDFRITTESQRIDELLEHFEKKPELVEG